MNNNVASKIRQQQLISINFIIHSMYVPSKFTCLTLKLSKNLIKFPQLAQSSNQTGRRRKQNTVHLINSNRVNNDLGVKIISCQIYIVCVYSAHLRDEVDSFVFLLCSNYSMLCEST